MLFGNRSGKIRVAALPAGTWRVPRGTGMIIASGQGTAKGGDMDITERVDGGGVGSAGRRLEVRILGERHRPLAAAPIAEAHPRWQSTVRECMVTADGHDLWCVVTSYRDEVLAGFDVEQTPERVTVRAWLAFGPDGPTSFGTGKVRVLPDGRRVGTMYRQAAGRKWATVVRLDQPLGTRPVVDVASPDPDGAGKARQAWLAARS